jgi:hypothetical protein
LVREPARLRRAGDVHAWLQSAEARALILIEDGELAVQDSLRRS